MHSHFLFNRFYFSSNSHKFYIYIFYFWIFAFSSRRLLIERNFFFVFCSAVVRVSVSASVRVVILSVKFEFLPAPMHPPTFDPPDASFASIDDLGSTEGIHFFIYSTIEMVWPDSWSVTFCAPYLPCGKTLFTLYGPKNFGFSVNSELNCVRLMAFNSLTWYFVAAYRPLLNVFGSPPVFLSIFFCASLR